MKKLNKGQSGFTLIELMIAIGIAGLITAGITFAIMQLLTINTRASNHMVAVRQVQQAGKEVSKDALQAQNVTCGVDCGFPLTLAWKDWEGSVNQVTYTITEDNELLRSHNITEDRVIAQYIDPNCVHTSCVLNAATKVLTFTVTATVGTESETRIYEVEPRPT
jgi:prepilin-type N-terminal cleavage/methylation domain-containing protein